MYKQSLQKAIVMKDQEIHKLSDKMAPKYILIEIPSHFTFTPEQIQISY